MTQGEIEKLTVKVSNIFSELEVRIMTDIVRRIKENGFASASVDWQISRLQQLGMAEEDIRGWIQSALQATDAEMDRIFSDEVYKQYYEQEHFFKLARMQQIPLEENFVLQQLIKATKKQLQGEYKNLTSSMGFAIRNPATGKIQSSPLMDYYRSTMDQAVIDIKSGAFDYNTVLKRTVNQMTASGLRYIEYDSGHRDRIDVAARRAILTGFRQVQSQIMEQVAEQLGTDTFEVSYHVGARPTHQPWQGKVWTRQELVSVCGLGEVTGLKGINCYHDYKPFPPGSVRTYTDEQLRKMLDAENTPKEYNGKQCTTYEALQQQRKMERGMRAQRQKIKLLQEGGADEQKIILAKAKYQGQIQTYKDFSEKMQLPEQKARIMQDGLKGKFMPTKAEQKVLEESAINDKIKAELSEAKIKGIPKINPDKIDVSKFTFDNSHINEVREHGVTRAEAEQFIKESDISLTRWNGRFINYYGPNGATYVDTENNNIRTAFKKEQFDAPTLKIREVAEKYGIKKD